MMVAGKETESRLFFLDNLRLFVVLCVVLEHSSHAYTNMMWWPVSDFAKSNIAVWLSAFTDAFAMPLLFYIAGYFAIPAIRKKGVTAFYIGKLNSYGLSNCTTGLSLYAQQFFLFNELLGIMARHHAECV
jgi:hypothetical protein